MKITQQTQFKFKTEIDGLSYNFSVIAGNEPEAKRTLAQHLKKIVQDLET